MNKKHYFFKYFVCSIFVESHQRRKFFNIEFFPNYGNSLKTVASQHPMWYMYKYIMYLSLLSFAWADQRVLSP